MAACPCGGRDTAGHSGSLTATPAGQGWQAARARARSALGSCCVGAAAALHQAVKAQPLRKRPISWQGAHRYDAAAAAKASVPSLGMLAALRFACAAPLARIRPGTGSCPALPAESC